MLLRGRIGTDGEVGIRVGWEVYDMELYQYGEAEMHYVVCDKHRTCTD